MGRHSSLPILFDEVKFISISKLKEWGYLMPNKFNSGTISWNRNGNTTGSICIGVSTYEDCSIVLDYKFRGEPVNYSIQLVKVGSNLGKGEIWYFVCPITGKRCRKLYSIGKMFLHRDACAGYLYEKQTYSKKSRYLIKFLEDQNTFEKIHAPYFKTMYNGQPTKRYKKYMNQLCQREKISIEQLLVS